MTGSGHDQNSEVVGAGQGQEFVSAGRLDGALGLARSALSGAVAQVDQRAAILEGIIGWTGGALLAWGAAQQQAGNAELGLPMIGFGIAVTGLFSWLVYRNRSNNVNAAALALELGEVARSEKAIAEAVTGERDRLLQEKYELTELKRALGDQIHAMFKDAKLQAEHCESMQLALLRMYQSATEIVDAKGKIATSDADLEDRLRRVLDTAERLVSKAIGIEPTELWTLSIYSRSNGKAGPTMKRLVAVSTDPDEKSDKREWPLGEGFVGEAWQADNELIVPDWTLAPHKDRFHARGERRQEHDLSNYRSVAVMPMRGGEIDPKTGRKPMIGLVISTSSRPMQFLSNERDPRALNASLIRNIAVLMNLLVTVWSPKKSTTFSAD